MLRPLGILAVSAGLGFGLQAAQTPQAAAGLIAGVVTDELNRPVPGVRVTGFRLSESGRLLEKEIGEYPTWPRGNVQKETNDLGEFRLWPLEAGEYVIAVVTSRVTRSVDDRPDEGCIMDVPVPSFVPFVRARPVDSLVDPTRQRSSRLPLGLTAPADGSAGPRAYVTTFSPRATAVTAAHRILVKDTQVARADIQLQLRPAVRVTGRLAGVKPAAPLDVELIGEVGGARTIASIDGSFVFLDIPAGPYTLASPGIFSASCDHRLIYPPSHQGRADVTVERGDQNHFVLTVGSQASAQRGPTPPPKPSERIPDAASIAGLVTNDAGHPLDRVRVLVTSAALKEGATAVTASNGRFVIDHLPPDAFTLTVSRAGYLSHLYGQRRRGGAGTLIALAPRQRFTANIVMPRPGVIAGVVRDERGVPMPGVSVCCDESAWAETDDRGRYRLWQIAAGDHIVRASAKGYQPIYFPAVSDERLAGKIRVIPGSSHVADIEVRPATPNRPPVSDNTDLTRPAELTARVTLVGPGQSASGFSWTLFDVGSSPGWNSAVFAGGTWVDLDATGRASIRDLSPGRYVLQVDTHGTWIASSALLDSRNVLDEPFTLEPGTTSELLVTLTKSATSLEGVVRNRAGNTAAGADVLIFSTDRRFWTPASRRIRLVRARTDGHYDVPLLPPGDYAVVALDDVDPDSVNPDRLQSLLAGAARITLLEGQTQSLSVRIR